MFVKSSAGFESDSVSITHEVGTSSSVWRSLPADVLCPARTISRKAFETGLLHLHLLAELPRSALAGAGPCGGRISEVRHDRLGSDVPPGRCG